MQTKISSNIKFVLNYFDVVHYNKYQAKRLNTKICNLKLF